MALIKCKECGKEFSDTSNTCPSCGYKKTHDSWTYKLLKILLYGMIGLYGIPLCIALLGFTLQSLRHTTNKHVANEIVENTMSDEERSKLFSGYQNIQFGMNKAQVKELFAEKLVRSREKYLEYTKDKAEITFWFFNDALYAVEVKPNAKKQRIGHGAATEDIKNTIGAMAAKYGPYQKIPNMVEVIEGSFQQPLEYYKWTFKDKEIILSYWDLGGWFNENTRNFGSAEHETLTITYRDLGIKQRKEQEETKQVLQKQQQAIQKKQQELDGLI